MLKGSKIILCTQYRYIQCYVKRVERLCYMLKQGTNTFLLITFLIFNRFTIRKSFGKLRLRPFQKYQCYVCQRGRKLFWLSTPLTCFDISFKRENKAGTPNCYTDNGVNIIRFTPNVLPFFKSNFKLHVVREIVHPVLLWSVTLVSLCSRQLSWYLISWSEVVMLINIRGNWKLKKSQASFMRDYNWSK